MKLFQLLQEAGCKPRNYGTYFTCCANYRGGNDPSSVAVYLQNNIVKDFVTGKVFSLEEFLKLTLNLNDTRQVLKILEDKEQYYSFEDRDKNPFEKQTKYYSNNDLIDLDKNNIIYWEGRGVSKSTLDIFEGGVCKSGKMFGRYVFPIFNNRKKIQGFTGRDVFGKSKIKWKHIGQKNEWAYPLIYNHGIIKEKQEIIIVESIGDMLSLWESGIKNTAVTFGTDIGKGLLKAIIRLDPKKIVIATNNDKNKAGQKASLKIKSSLTDFFDEDQIIIKMPTKNDFGDQSVEENQQWYASL